jgi:hypothetical protein
MVNGLQAVNYELFYALKAENPDFSVGMQR